MTVIGRPGGELMKRCAAAGIPAVPLRLRNYLRPTTILGLARELRRAQAEVVVAYDERSLRVAALATRLVRGKGGACPPLVFYYGLEGSFKNTAYNRIVVTPRVSRVIANAHAIAEELLAFGWIPKERMRVIYDGVDPTPIQSADPSGVREELGVTPDDVVALVVARLVPDKGHAFLLDAVGRIADPSARPVLWFAGQGGEEAHLREKVTALGLEGRVRLLGFRTDVPRLLRAVDMLIHPSRREGAPNAVREAMCAGLPVAAVAASGTPELMVEGETGYLSPIGDVEALRNNVERLVRDRGLRKRMGEAGLQRALSEFSEETCAERWLTVLQEAVSAAP